ncbi:MAG: hypothetical protein HZA06_04515 [Nitrospirae bacterium]|nr:hypothetical protein [Nitrospirota bacterium]
MIYRLKKEGRQEMNVIRIAVTGHRVLPHYEATARSVRDVISRIEKSVRQRGASACKLVLLSPIAEGADRLVVNEMLNRTGWLLEVVLPLEASDYMKDFDTAESKEEFKKLMAMASKTQTLPAKRTRNEAYEAVGHFVVDNSDILIALWNGKESRGKGGTAEIVDYARRRKKPLYWINTERPEEVAEERVYGWRLQRIYEGEHTASEEIKKKIEEYEAKLRDCLTKGIDDKKMGKASADLKPLIKRLDALCRHFLPHYAKADALANKYQRIYRLASKSIYIMAASSVIVVSAQYIFHDYIPEKAIFLEIALMVLILFIIGYGNHIGWHRRWLDYRLLAERLRFGLLVAFLADKTACSVREDFHCKWLEDSWPVSLYMKIQTKNQRLKPAASSSLYLLKIFLNAAWLDYQKSYHEKKSKGDLKKHRAISRTGEVFYGLTLLAAVFHAFHVGNEFMARILTFLAIAFPVTGAAFSALRAHFEYKKIAERSHVMAIRLNRLQGELNNVKDMEDFRKFVYSAEALMFEENADWHVSMGIHDLEPPA